MNRLSLPSFALRRPVTMCMVVVTVLGLGCIVWYLTPIQFLPRVDVPFLHCYIPYPGAAPTQVEKEIALPAEGEFQTLAGLRRITTYSHGGGCSVFMRFDWDSDMALASAELRDRIERLKMVLPQEIDRVFIHRYSSDQAPILRFALFRDYDQDDLARASRTMLKNRLLRVSGVADVEVSGRENTEVRVEFDQNALRSLNVGIYQVISRLQSAGMDITVGQLLDGQTKYFVRTLSEFRTADELAEAIVGPNGIRLRDVAAVEEREPDGAGSFTIDGKAGVFISVQKESEANTVAACDGIREELERIRADPVFRDVEMFVFEDQSEVIRFAMDALLRAGKYGSALAFVVLFVFLRRAGSTLVVALATPASLLAGLVVLYFMGRTLNMVTMAAMLVSIGMLVDNAIVVVENIHRHYALHPGRTDNARRGAEEVGVAITAATFTTIVVFIPTIYMESGELSLFMKEFAPPISASLLASLLLALTMIPLAEAYLLQRHAPRAARPKGERFGWVAGLVHALAKPRPILRLRGLYDELLTVAVDRRHITMGLLAALIAVTYYVAYRSVGMQQMPSMDTRQVNVHFRADPQYGEETVEATMERFESTINSRREELGIKNIYANRWSTGGRLHVYLYQDAELPPGASLTYTTEEVRRILSVMLPETVPGGRIDCGLPQTASTSSASISLRLLGENTQVVEQHAEDFGRLMSALPGITDVDDNLADGEDEIQVQVDESRAAALGATPMVIARTVDFALRGTRLPYLKEDGQEVPVWAQLSGEDRKTKGNLENVAVHSETGGLVPLSQLVDMHQAPALRGVYRENGKSVSTLTARTLEKDLTEVRRGLDYLVENFDLPRGYSVTMGDEFRQLDENLQNFRNALILSLILIFLVMAALFESLLLPLSVLTSVALAFVGVYWSMYFTDTPLDTISLIGAILMCGIIVNNGIVIIDHINQLRKEGAARREAVLQAGHNRFRPVLMTSLTTILGVVPLAIGAGGNASALTSLGRALVGGLTAGTALTLLVVPVAYTLVDDVQVWFRNYAGNLAQLGPSRDSG